MFESFSAAVSHVAFLQTPPPHTLALFPHCANSAKAGTGNARVRFTTATTFQKYTDIPTAWGRTLLLQASRRPIMTTRRVVAVTDDRGRWIVGLFPVRMSPHSCLQDSPAVCWRALARHPRSGDRASVTVDGQVEVDCAVAELGTLPLTWSCLQSHSDLTRLGGRMHARVLGNIPPHCRAVQFGGLSHDAGACPTVGPHSTRPALPPPPRARPGCRSRALLRSPHRPAASLAAEVLLPGASVGAASNFRRE